MPSDEARQPAPGAASWADPAGGVAALIRTRDWSTSPLGPPAAWPASLKTTVGMMLPAQAQIVLFWGPDYAALYNDAYAPTIGDKHPRAFGQPAVESWTELWDDLEPLLRRVRETGETVSAKDRPFYIERHGYGEDVFFDISYSPIRDEAGAVAGVLCIVSETTERVRAEAALRHSEARLRFLGELDEALRESRDAPGAMLAAARHLARRLGASRCAYADLDADNDRFVIRNDFTAPGIASSAGTYSLDLFGPRAAADMRGGRTLIVRDVAGELAPGEGREMFLAIGIGAIVCCPLVKDGRLVAMMAVHQDRPRDWTAEEIALVEAVVERCWAHVERVGAEARLRELNATLEQRVAERTAERQLLATIVEVTDVQIQALDLDYRWLAINAACADAYARTFGKRPQVGESLLETLADRPDHQAAVRGVWARALAGEAYTMVAGWGDPALDRRTFEMKFETLRGMDGALIGAFLTSRDITDRIEEQARLARAEDGLRQAQKMEAVGQLTGGVAHDFNNLLTIIRSSTDLLRRPNVGEERRRRYVDAIAETVDRAAKLTGQLLAFARRQALKPEVFDPGERVRSVTDMLRTVVGARVRIVADIAAEPCPIKADASQFETALVNMAVNARDAMDGEGTLTIRVTPAGAMPRGHAGTPGRFVAVSLTDTGHGIPADRLGQVFEPFYTTKEVGKGTGLGLSQVYGFARQSGGDVAVESQVGRGTTFTLYLPQAEPIAAEADAPDPRADAAIEDGHGRRVLLVEDNIEVGRFSSQVLEDLGYDPTWAVTASQALELLAAGRSFDVVFSDVVMPGMSGIELGQEIRRRHPGLPIVLTSGYSHVLAEEGRHGFELLHKPYAAEELSRTLRRVTRSRPTPS